MEIPQALREVMDYLEKVNFDELQRTELGIDFNFKDSISILKEIYNDLKNVVDNASLLRVTDQKVQQISNLSEELKACVEKIQGFILKDNPNATNEHKGINDQIKTLSQRGIEILVPLYDYVIVSRSQGKAKEINELTSKAKKDAVTIKKITESLKNTQTEAEKTIQKISVAYGEKGANISRKDFEDQANYHRDVARKWFYGMWYSMAFAILIVVFLFSSGFGLDQFDFLDQEKIVANYLKLIYATIFKVIVLSIVSLSIQQCLKNYRINSHLYVVNRHRQLTLTVYPLMANATNNLEQSNIIVAQAVKAIFDSGSTGYLDASGDGTPPVNLTEIINHFIQDKKS